MDGRDGASDASEGSLLNDWHAVLEEFDPAPFYVRMAIGEDVELFVFRKTYGVPEEPALDKEAAEVIQKILQIDEEGDAVLVAVKENSAGKINRVEVGTGSYSGRVYRDPEPAVAEEAVVEEEPEPVVVEPPKIDEIEVARRKKMRSRMRKEANAG